MAILDKTQLKAKIDSLITTNGAKAITGAIHNEVLTDVIDSLANLITDVSSLGFYQYDPAKQYGINELTWYNGNFYISLVATTGAFTAADFLQLTNLTDQSDYSVSFPVYNAGTTYNIGDGALYNNQYFICDVNGTTGITPDDAGAEWSLVFAHNGDESKVWSDGYYLQNQIITFDNKRYYLTADTAAGAYHSTTDPVTDSANWDQFNASAGGGSQTLAQTLALGNTTGGTDPVISAGDKISSVNGGFTLEFINNLLGSDYFLFGKGGDGLIFIDGGYLGALIGGSNRFFIDPALSAVGLQDDYDLLFNSPASNNTRIVRGAPSSAITVTLPSQAGTLARVEDLPINTRRYVAEQSNTFITLTNVNQVLTTPINPSSIGGGIYFMSLQVEVLITGDETVFIELKDGATIRESREITNNQGGGAARTVRQSVFFETPAFTYGGVNSFTVEARHNAGGGAQLIKTLFRAWKLNN